MPWEIGRGSSRESFRGQSNSTSGQLNLSSPYILILSALTNKSKPNMNRPKDSQKPANSSAAPAKPDEEAVFSLGTLYLLFYNWVSAILWAALLGRVILALVNDDYTHVYERAGFFAKWTQTLAAMEVLHSLFRA